MSISNDYSFANVKAIKVHIWLQGKAREETLTAPQLSRTLLALTLAGQQGITALEMGAWAIRLAAYVHKLKSLYALDIETGREDHTGGWHARYILLTPVDILDVMMD